MPFRPNPNRPNRFRAQYRIRNWQDVVERMEGHDVKRVPVVSNGKVVGIISHANLLQVLMRKADRASDPQG